jgi:BirA family biotin operon repressor/biotin-[acetyl-CoA-carboxylase] ligase
MDFNIEWHDRLGSTNAYLRERFYRDAEMPSGLVAAAHDQTAGRGRQERTWQSAPCTNLCFSVFLETDAPLVQVPSLTMAAALAVCELLYRQGFRAAPKWPNDVLIDGKKLCGILSERVETSFAKASELKRSGIIIGIGLNVNMTSSEAEHIDRPATSMLIEAGRAYKPEQILEELLPHLERWIERWQAGGFPALREVWTDQAGPIGKRLSVHDGEIIKKGILSGFGEHGELLLETENGLETIWSGDVN